MMAMGWSLGMAILPKPEGYPPRLFGGGYYPNFYPIGAVMMELNKSPLNNGAGMIFVIPARKHICVQRRI